MSETSLHSKMGDGFTLPEEQHKPTLADESSNGMQCHIFNCRKNELPQIQSVGDIVYLQNRYVTKYRGAP